MAGALRPLPCGHAKAYRRERILVIFLFTIGFTGHPGHILAPSPDSRSCLIWLSPTARLIMTFIAVRTPVLGRAPGRSCANRKARTFHAAALRLQFVAMLHTAGRSLIGAPQRATAGGAHIKPRRAGLMPDFICFFIP